MPLAGPFYFAWVEPYETSFDDIHHRMDEYIFSARRSIAEGEKPLLEIEIQNPHVGILSPTRKYWAWFAWFNGTTVEPIFFGRVVGTPVRIFEEIITLQLVADPLDYKLRVQMLAETLKYQPFYDPLFIDISLRDDPNTILEAHAKVWDVDPITLAVTANDIITGTDGNEDFTADDHFYDGMQMSIGQPPTIAIMMDASINWTQAASGVVDMGSYRYTTLSGDGMLGDWPKPGQQLGGGYSVATSEITDDSGTNAATMSNFSWQWTNKEKEHSDGDSMSKSLNASTPVGGRIAAQRLLTEERQPGFLDPFAVDGNGDPAPINRPMRYNSTTGYVLQYDLSAKLALQYEAERPRTERIVFVMVADTQPILTDPDMSEETEVMTRNGADAGVPIANLVNWRAVAEFEPGQIIFPDNPNIPGGKSAQICISGGIVGPTPPAFSDIVGVATVDGTVTWSSLGRAAPLVNAVDWTPISSVNLGQIIQPRRPAFVAFGQLQLPGKNRYPQVDVAVTEGQIVQAANGSYQVCTLAGDVPPNVTPAFSAVWGDVTAVGSSQWTSLGVSLPYGNAYFIATQAGVTGPEHLIPAFDTVLDSTTVDNTVAWTCIGNGYIPAGGIPGNVPAPTYFAADGGLGSLGYLALLVRARLLYRARCVEIQFDCDYARGVSLTTRKTVTLHDPRIPGGTALGKLKAAELSVSDTGVAGCRVTIMCCAGLGGAVEENEGDPLYVDAGYVDDYQKRDNVVVVLPGGDLGYEPPSYAVADDGLTFPLTRDMITVINQVNGDQIEVARQALDAMQAAAQGASSPNSLNQEYLKKREDEMIKANTLPMLLRQNPIWHEIQLKPVNGGVFHNVYNVRVSHLKIPMGINLQASSMT
jgi:hypothetical protein